MTTKAVGIKLPPQEQAPGLRDGIRDRANWKLTELDGGSGLVEPAEGAGACYPYFKITKLCDATHPLSDEARAALKANSGGAGEDIPLSTDPSSLPTTEWSKKLIEWGNKVAASGRNGAALAGVSANIAALPPEEVPDYIDQQAAVVFKDNPEGSFWFFESDPLFPSRAALLRVLLALETIPDFTDHLDPGTQQFPQIVSLQEHTLTGGFATENLVEPLLLAIPPATLGYAFSWMPHAIVFLIGHPASLIEPHPPTLASLYQPGMQSGFGFHWGESDFFEGVGSTEAETLLQWWATRLNVIYSHAFDPTNFDDGNGLLDIRAQTVWFLTFERLLADALAIGSSPQGTALTRTETAFDLLDKAESLLGYGQDKTKKGFMRLLRRGEMVERLNKIWDARLPVQLRQLFKDRTEHLYDRIYEHARDNAYEFRLLPKDKGINVWSADQGKLVEWQWDDYVPALVRAVRNSAHGLMGTFEKKAERDIVATHSGKMAPELPELAAFIAFAMVADAERLCAGEWWN